MAWLGAKYGQVGAGEGEAKVDSYLNAEGLREALCVQDRALFSV